MTNGKGPFRRKICRPIRMNNGGWLGAEKGEKAPEGFPPDLRESALA